MTKNRPESALAIDIGFNLCFTKTELSYKQRNSKIMKTKQNGVLVIIQIAILRANYNTLKQSNYKGKQIKKSLYR